MARYEIPSGYLRNIILTANEVLDFYTHLAILLDPQSQRFEYKWHYLGVHPRLGNKWRSSSRQDILYEVMHRQRPTISLPQGLQGLRRVRENSMLISLYIGDNPIGVLLLSPPEGTHFTLYEAYLANCIVEVIGKSYCSNTHRDMFNPLQFWMLHRRHFLAATPTLNQVLTEYLERLVEEAEFRVLPKSCDIFGNIRVILPSVEKKDDRKKQVCLQFSQFIGNYDPDTVSVAQERRLTINRSDIRTWINSWAKFKKEPPRDIDTEYLNIFHNVHSHVGIPCWYHGNLYGILSVDSSQAKAIKTPVIQALTILGSQMAPIIANAQVRSRLAQEQRYLRSVLDAIPDELLIVNEDARIVRMNEAKQKRFRNARIGQYCYDAFEYGREDKCHGCYTLRTLDTKEAIRQALWQYVDPETHEPNYVEISTGCIDIDVEPGEKRQAVELVRYVGGREALIEWMANTQALLFLAREKTEDEEGIPQWLVQHIAIGLRKMRFPRYRVYVYKDACFYGRICFPTKSYAGRDFSTFFLDPEKDVPSKVSLEDEELRPVRFVIQSSLKKTWWIPDEESEWNYRTCYLREVPTECAKYLGKKDIRSWIDVPLGAYDRASGKIEMYGKISVDRGRGHHRKLEGAESDTAYEMALLATFGRFTSVAIHTARQHEAIVEAERIQTGLDYAHQLAHELNSYKASLRRDLECISTELPNLFRKFTPDLLGTKSSSSLKKATKEVLIGLCTANLRPSVRPELSPQQTKLSNDIIKAAKTIGLEIDQEDIVPLIVSGKGAKFLHFICLPDFKRDTTLPRFMISVASILSMLQTALDTQRTVARLHASLTVGTALQEARAEATNIEEGLEIAIRMVGAIFEGTTNIKYNNPKSMLPKISSYANSLRFVWINLLRNAVEATGNTKEVKVSLGRQRGYVVVKISDRGKGLPKRIRRLLSEPARTDVVTRGRDRGRNLGLMLSKRVVEAHQGSIQVVSSTHKGTTLAVRIPIKEMDK